MPTNLDRLMAICHELVANPSHEAVLHLIVQRTSELLDCETAAILLLDESSNSLRFVAMTLDSERLFDIPVPIEASIAGAAFLSNEPLIVSDAQSDERHYPRVAEVLSYAVRSLIAVPLTFREHKIGVLEASNKREGRSFDAADAEVMGVLAAQATIAIENARLLDQYRRLAQTQQSQREMAEALRLAGAALASTLDYDQVIDRILEQVNRVIPGDASNVMMIEAGAVGRVVRGRGYDRFGTAATLTATTLNVQEVTGLRTMLATGRPLLIPDVAEDPTWVYSRPEHRWIRSYVGAPIIVRGVALGFLNAMSAAPDAYQQHHAEQLQAFADHAAIAIENARLYRRAQEEIAERARVEEELRRHRSDLEELVRERTAEIHRLAMIDPLTELFNRRQLMLLGQQTLNQAQRYQHALAVMMIDIDHFKQINDTYGHAVGDEALRALADLIRKQLRAADIPGRYGGEEFVVLMPETTLSMARRTAERLLEHIRALRIETAQPRLRLSASIGLTVLSSVTPQSLDALIAAADRAMYRAKRAGRDRVVALIEEHAPEGC